MRKRVIATILGLTTYTYANINAIVSIAPQKTFVEAIGANKIDVSLMVTQGSSPHTYEPKPSQMKEITKADIYFTIDVEFEHIWLSKFTNQNQKMKVFDISKDIIKQEIETHSHGGEEQHHDKTHASQDPHIWTSPKNVKIIVKNIYNTLIKIDAKNKTFYKENLDKYLTHIENTDKKIKEILKDVPKNAKFMVFHPAWGYFAKEYNLKQLPIEIEGKSIKPKTLAHILKEAKEEDVKAIFTQVEFSDKIAQTIANQLKIEVIKTTPLSENWSENLINLAKAIANKR